MSKPSAPWALVWAALLLTFSTVASAVNSAEAGSPNQDCHAENLLLLREPMRAEDVSGNRALVTDGAVPEEGTDWDTLSALILETNSGTLTYDLGQVRQVGAVYLQADANDTYTVSGSTSPEPASFQLLTELPLAVNRGAGLRNRTATFALRSVRYLRIAVGAGDNAYSVSEFAAYCQAPDRFPPTLARAAIVEGPSATAPNLASQKSIQVVDVTAELWLKLAGLLAIVAGTIEATRRRAAQKRESCADARSQALWGDRLLCGLFFTSGCAALIYEVIWFHLLRLVIGASAISMAIVLASFMGGMFLGSLLYAHFVRRSLNPVVVYAVLEIGIGVFGLLMPVLLPAVKYVYIGLVGYGSLGIALRAVIAAVLLLPPTALMGATLPAIARRYEPGRRGMAGLSSLYAANTLGAVAGCLVSAFYLLAVWDVWVATVFAVVLNFGLGAVALRWRERLFNPSASRPPKAVEAGAADAAVVLGPVYLAAALSGVTSLGAQVIWTRLLTLLFGASVYAFAIILAVFLAGLGIGSAWASRLLRRGFDGTRGLMHGQLALVPTMLLGGYLLAEALPYGSPPGWIPMQSLHALHIVRAVVVVLPATIFWGTSFPFALAAAGAGHDDTGRSTGLVYASNTIGAIIGTLGVSFWLIPAYGTHRAGQVLILIAAISAAALWATITRNSVASPAGKAPGLVRGRSSIWPLVVGALGVGLLPAFPKQFLAHGRYLIWVDQRDQYPYVSEGAASTVAVHIAPDGYSNFHVSGRVEATNNPNDLRTERLIGHISAFAHPHPESVLVVGLGAGVTAGALTLHPEIRRIVICEIEPRVVGATNLFAKENYSVLSNPRVEVVFDDARHYLATTREKFDIITSDPIHPWVRGNSILFSREYYAIVRAHLKPGGLASQWVPLYETSELAIQIQAKTFMQAFADGTVWNTITDNRGYDVVFVGSEQPLRIDVNEVQVRIDRSPLLEASLREVKLGGAVSLLSTYGTSGRDMSAWLTNVPVNRDFSLKLEYISGLAINSHDADGIYAHMSANRTFPEQLFAGTPETLNGLRRRILGAPAQ